MILHEILKSKKAEVARLKKKRPLSALKRAVSRLPVRQPSFLRALCEAPDLAVIAEIKRKSPSAGELHANADAAGVALAYQKAGASALSVLTDGVFFGGSAEDLERVRKAVTLPILRKDFTVDAYQILEARLLGADAVLLIAQVLEREALSDFSETAASLGLDALFEVHSPEDVEKILPLKPKLVGINNRNLKTFHVDIRTTAKLIESFPKSTTVVSESGIQNGQDLLYLKNLGVRAVLIGERLMRQPDPGVALGELIDPLKNAGGA